ncbi:MAG: DEAD/DEAH box helicase [Flavobacteriia bacterium]|nr:DEAD/DEAH box helicase [Flavobacteriia bacterium]OJX34935.1 MAG: DEAD/DEAH box helicase [Flavobacteriia bacterium 40-80]
MKFEELNLTKPLLNAIEGMGYDTPTLIQEKAFPVIMSGKDILGIAQTGTGKTLAYLLPSLRLWQFAKNPYPQILIIVPTRELVQQVCDELARLSMYMNVVTVGVYGGANIRTQAAEILQGVDVVVGTPGRVMDLILHGDLIVKNIKRLIIDEVDETLNLGFRKQLTTILDLLPERKQSLLFSATMDEEIEAIIDEYFVSPTYVEAAPSGTPIEKIQQLVYEVPNYNTKLNLLHKLLDDEDLKKVLIFTESKKYADALFEKLKLKYEERVDVIHSNKAQNYRFNAVNKFKSGELKILVATDLVSRGMDISEVTHVINLNVPVKEENYIHRIGRTGRQEKKGVAITLVSALEKDNWDAIEKFINMEVERLPIPSDVIISEELTLDEQPEVKMKNVLVKLPKRENVGPSFHEKKLKNQKDKKKNVKPKDKKKIKKRR